MPETEEALSASASDSTPHQTIDLRHPPAVASLYLRSLFDRRPGSLKNPDAAGRVEARIREVTPAAATLARYRAVCGFAPSPWLPISFPHVLAAGLHLRMLLSPAFPVRLPGLVHIWHEIEQVQPIPEGVALEVGSWIDGVTIGSRGAEFCLHTVVHGDGGVSWKEKTGFLARHMVPPAEEGGSLTTKSTPKAESKTVSKSASNPVSNAAVSPEPEFSQLARYELAANLGRRYARASGDYNPIHLFRATARAFGFKAAIAHGMWSLARCAATLMPEDESKVRIKVQFRRPLMLPATAVLEAGPAEASRHFRLFAGDNKTTYLTGLMERI